MVLVAQIEYMSMPQPARTRLGPLPQRHGVLAITRTCTLFAQLWQYNITCRVFTGQNPGIFARGRHEAGRDWQGLSQDCPGTPVAGTVPVPMLIPYDIRISRGLFSGQGVPGIS